MTLHGPAHPEEFRVQVGRYGERFYHDPLPADERWSATDETWPSVTTVKKASDRDWSWVSLQRAADYLFARAGELDELNAGEIHARLLEVNRAGLGRAASRGTAIHHVAEMIYAGQTWLPGTLGPEAEEYVPALQKFFDDCQPEFIASEIVCLHRGHHDGMGYGGTCDAVLRLNGKLYVVDWKTRSPGKHAAYPEEAMQLAAYRHCQYVVVDNNGTAARQPFPEVAGGLVVSIAPEGYRLFPVDLDEAWQAFQTLRAWWSDKQRPMVGKAIVMGGAKGDRDAASSNMVGGGDEVVCDADQRRPGSELAPQRGELGSSRQLGGREGQPAPAILISALPPEGEPVDVADIDTLIRHLHQLQTDHPGVGELYRRWSREALDAKGDIRLRVKDGDGWQYFNTVRRFEIGRAMLRCVEYVVANPRRFSAFAGIGESADAVMRALIDLVLGEEQQITFPIGGLLATLRWDEAEGLALVAHELVDGVCKLTRKGGRLIVKVA